MREKLLRMLTSRVPLRFTLAQKTIQSLSLFSYEDRLKLCAVDRPHYGHCLYEAAKLAARLGYPRISAIEFGCGGGKGLLAAEMHISQLEKIFPVHVELYGFDTGKGLPAPEDYRDFPHYFKTGDFSMKKQQLCPQLQRAKLVLGNVKDTCETFFDRYEAAPVGCIFHDLDFYSSTRDSFNLLDAGPHHFLPRVFMYFDDVEGDNTWLISEYAGELLAIDKFNQDHSSQKIAANRAMSKLYYNDWWTNRIYVYHDFQHPKYNLFIANEEVKGHEANISLN
jgi:hypothetical protein